MAGEGLTGSHRVRLFRPAFDDIRRLCCNRVKPGMEIRRHFLKLRFWGDMPGAVDERGEIVDLDYESIKALPGRSVYELRINDTIAGNDNLRAIFFIGDPKVREPLPMIWVLTVLQKKRQYFTKGQLAIFDARRRLVVERFYQLPRA